MPDVPRLRSRWRERKARPAPEVIRFPSACPRAAVTRPVTHAHHGTVRCPATHARGQMDAFPPSPGKAHRHRITPPVSLSPRPSAKPQVRILSPKIRAGQSVDDAPICIAAGHELIQKIHAGQGCKCRRNAVTIASAFRRSKPASYMESSAASVTPSSTPPAGISSLNRSMRVRTSSSTLPM